MAPCRSFFRGKFQDESAIVEEKIRMASREDKHLLGTAFVTFTSTQWWLLSSVCRSD